MMMSPRFHRRQKHRSIGRMFLGIFGILFLMSAVSGYAWYAFSGWNGRDPVNVVISVGNRLFVAAVRPESNRLLILPLPPNMIVQVGEGSWQVRALWQLSTIERQLTAVEAVGWNLLETPIDGVIRIPQWDGQADHFPGVLRLLSGGSVRSLPGRGWSLPSVLRLAGFLGRLNPSQVTVLDLTDLPATRRVVDPGGTELLSLDTSVMSPILSQWFQIDQLRLEGLSVAIVNASGKSGAGSKLARQIQHVGIRTVFVENGDGSPQLVIRSKNLASTLTVKKLSSWFHLRPVVGPIEQRSDIEIVIGVL